LSNKTRSSWPIYIAVLLIAAGLAYWGIGRINAVKPIFNGSRVCGDGQYVLQFDILNREDTYTFDLQKDDMLDCAFSVTSGRVDVLITDGNGEKLYRGDDVRTAAFTLTATKAGSYTVSVTGKNAKGSIAVERIPAN